MCGLCAAFAQSRHVQRPPIGAHSLTQWPFSQYSTVPWVSMDNRQRQCHESRPAFRGVDGLFLCCFMNYATQSYTRLRATLTVPYAANGLAAVGCRSALSFTGSASASNPQRCLISSLICTRSHVTVHYYSAASLLNLLPSLWYSVTSTRLTLSLQLPGVSNFRSFSCTIFPPLI